VQIPSGLRRKGFEGHSHFEVLTDQALSVDRRRLGQWLAWHGRRDRQLNILVGPHTSFSGNHSYGGAVMVC
jgi:hypothetical protein